MASITTDYNTHTVKVLREELVSRGLKKSGNKEELILRLQEDDDDSKLPPSTVEEEEEIPNSQEVPEINDLDLMCTITHDLLEDPVVAADGHTYSRKAIERWLSRNDKSPLTNEELTSDLLFPNHFAEKHIQNYKTLLGKKLIELIERTPNEPECEERVINLLNDANANLETRREQDRRTPLLVACSLGLSSLVEALLNNGADYNATDMEGVGAADLLPELKTFVQQIPTDWTKAKEIKTLLHADSRVPAAPARPQFVREMLDSFQQNQDPDALFNSMSTLLTNHKDCVRSLTMVNADILASGSTDTDMNILLRGQIPELPEEFKNMNNGCIKLWDWKTGALIKNLKTDAKSLTMVNENILASGSKDKTVKLWDWKRGACIKTLTGHSGWVVSLTMVNADILASGSWDKTVKLWDWKKGACIKTLTGHSGFVTSLTMGFSNADILASGSSDKTVKLWDWKTGAERESLKTFSREYLRSVSSLTMVNADILASAGEDGVITLWIWLNGGVFKTLTGHSYGVNSLTMVNADVLASGSYGTIKLWDCHFFRDSSNRLTITGACIKTLRHSGTVYSLTMVNENILASGSQDGDIKLWGMTLGIS